jgi:hypothetical protein
MSVPRPAPELTDAEAATIAAPDVKGLADDVTLHLRQTAALLALIRQREESMAVRDEDLEGGLRNVEQQLRAIADRVDEFAYPAVHPPLGEPVTWGQRVADCPVCGAAIMDKGEDLACTRCDTKLHRECYWRSVPLAEWQAWITQVNGGPGTFDAAPTVCAQCRAKDDDSDTPAEPTVLPLRRRARATEEG